MFAVITSFAKASEKAKKLMAEKKEEEMEAEAPKAPTEVEILSEIRDLLKKEDKEA